MISLDNLTAEERKILDAMKASGIPTTAEALEQEFQKLADAENLAFSNKSLFSPFWRLIKAVATTPVLWLLAFTVKFVVPNSFAKLAKGVFLDWFAWGQDLERFEAQKLLGVITFNRKTIGTELVIPKNTIIKTPIINGAVYRVFTLEEQVIPASAYNLDVEVEAEKEGTAYNLAAGYFTILEEPITGVSEITNKPDWITTPGTDNESDEDLRARIRNDFTAQSSFHIDAVYRKIIAEIIGFNPSRIYFTYDKPRGPGSADAYILFDAGVPGEDYINEVNQHIRDDGNHGHGDDLLTKKLPESAQAVTATMFLKINLAEEQKTLLKKEIENFIRCAFRENSDYDEHITKTWPFDRFSFSKLGEEIHLFFPDVISIRWSNNDIVSQLEIPVISTLTLTWDNTYYGRTYS